MVKLRKEMTSKGELNVVGYVPVYMISCVSCIKTCVLYTVIFGLSVNTYAHVRNRIGSTFSYAI